MCAGNAYPSAGIIFRLMATDGFQFSIEMAVRDYELDYQGIVNNANYLHYLEHTRHEFCRAKGITFAQLHQRGIDPVLRTVQARYQNPLRADDTFVSCLNLVRRGPKFVFEQRIFRPDGTPVMQADITVACLENGILTRGDSLAQLFGL